MGVISLPVPAVVGRAISGRCRSSSVSSPEWYLLQRY